jgi:uncharacterized protein YqhQ
MKRSNIGGQGVLEGVMMRSPEESAIAVRRQTGEIVYKRSEFTPLSKKNKFYGWPIVRGVVMFIDTLGTGVKTLSDSAKMYDESAAKDYEPSKFEKYIAKKTGKSAMDVMMAFAVVIAIGLAIGLFFVLPTVVANFVRPFVASGILMNLIEGGIRLLIFMGYLMLVIMMKDIRRVFAYHGAEHKVINCFEHEEELTVENVQKYTTLHPRCGTSYLLIVMVIAILLFSLLGWSNEWYLRFGLRLLMLPVVAGVSYEFLRLGAKGESLFFRIIRAPGMALQHLTTKPPEDGMVEVAIVAFEAAMKEKTDAEIDARCEAFYRGEKKEEPAPEGEPAIIEEISEKIAEAAASMEDPALPKDGE